ncbi:hypothetical protein NUW58_g8101 [Xylaria curta]|uniref:Uncharacterized protein n=1 Tax=Xylaria curta TaxID=42375 RepID=A0ACC1ND06_9PEZI|nr:hypothetical protein NUW58_g8101 [Xylaria curta]
MRAVFQGERNAVGNGSCLTGVQGMLTPPPDHYPLSPPSSPPGTAVDVKGWMEFWDYAGGASFRAFVAEKGDKKSLFAFFDSGLVGQDLKQALIALIELAEVPLGCSDVVICLDRYIPEDQTKSLMRSLQWVGFELTALDYWADDLDVSCFCEVVFHLLHGVLASVEHASSQSGVRRCLAEDFLKVAGIAGAAGRDDGDAHGGLDLGDELEVEAVVGAVAVDAVEQELAGAHGLDGLGELDDVEVAGLAAALDGAGVPAVVLAAGAGEAGAQGVVAGGVGAWGRRRAWGRC